MVQEELSQTWQMFSHNGEAQWFWKGHKGTSGGRIYSKDGLSRLIQAAEAAHQDLYLNINATRRCGIKASRRDVLIWRYIVLDMDPTGPARPSKEDAEKLLELFSGGGVYIDSKGVTILDSGRGIQVWLTIEPRTVDNNAKEIERGMSALLHLLAGQLDTRLHWRLDTSCSDLARVVRCPGSINQKTGARAHLLTVGVAHLRGLSEYVLTLRGSDESSPVLTAPSSTDIVGLLPYLTHTARRFILYGIESPGRHSAAYAAAKNLHEIGVSAETAFMHMERGAARCRIMRWDDEAKGWCIAPYPLPRADLIRIIERIWNA